MRILYKFRSLLYGDHEDHIAALANYIRDLQACGDDRWKLSDEIEAYLDDLVKQGILEVDEDA